MSDQALSAPAEGRGHGTNCPHLPVSAAEQLAIENFPWERRELMLMVKKLHSKKIHLANVELSGEAASAAADGAGEWPDISEKTIKECGFTDEEIFNMYESLILEKNVFRNLHS